MTVYADILLLVNFSMDFLTLFFTGRLLHKPKSKWRYTAAALVGGTGGTVRTIAVVNPSPAGTAVSGFVLSAVMVLIAYKPEKSPIRFLRDCFTVWGCGVFLGGMMTWLLSLGEPFAIDTESSGMAFVGLIFICFGLSSFAVRIVSVHRCRKSSAVTVHACGEVYRFTALCDSGNLASEPISGLPVIIVKKGILTSAEEELAKENCSLPIRAVPISGIGGGKLEIGFIPEKITVDGCERKAVLVIADNREGFAGFDGLLPAALC